jgi:predicted ABC-type ATPase
LLTAKIADQEGLSLHDANLAAVERIETWLDASINAYQTIGVETVLSSPKYRRLVDLALTRGFHVRMLYVVLANTELQMKRIRNRVAEGGHDVPRDKVIARRARSFEQLAWFLGRVSQCVMFHNSSGEPRIVGENVGRNQIALFERLPTDMQASLKANGIVVVGAQP